MKQIIALIGVTALLVTVSHAQVATFAGPNPLTGIPATLANGTTNYPIASAPLVDVSKAKDWSISVTTSTATAGGTNTYYFAPSVDNVYYDTNTADELIFSNGVASGNFTATKVQNYTGTTSSGGVQSYKLVSILATSAGTMTNVAANYAQKISAP